MPREIERRFIVTDTRFLAGRSGECIVQGYPVKEQGHMSVRVRIRGENAYLSLKSPTVGASRDEFEYPIPLDHARHLIAEHCQHRIVRKTRYLVEYAQQCFEVDVFAGLHAGLVIAELELRHENQLIVRPPWLGSEVTGDGRYGNFSLALAEQASLSGGFGPSGFAGAPLAA